MKIIASALVCLLAAGEPLIAQQSAVSPQPAHPSAPTSSTMPPAPNTLLDGTPVKLKLAETITSATAKVGQSVAFEVIDEVDVQGVQVVAKGAPALATVTTAETKKSMGRGGKLDVNIDSVRLVDGEKAALCATKGAKGGGHTGAMTAGIVGTAIVFFPAAPLLLFVHGKDITIPKGTEVTAFISGDMKLDMAKMVPPGTITPIAEAGATAMASLMVEANVTGADIEVDGAFVGSTPSKVSIAPGQHTVTVKKKGYSEWSRSMNIAGTGAKINADLESQTPSATK